MTYRNSTVLALSLALFTATALGAQDAPAQKSPDPVPPPLREALPALADQSSWAQDATYEGDRPDKRTRGVYPVGNGHVFGYMGLGRRANTMQGITGPHYQTDEVFAPKGHFGEATIELTADGEPVALDRQRVRRVRGANFVVTEDAAPDGLALRTLSFAPPDGQHLTRVLEVVNNGDAPVAGIGLRLVVEGDARAEDGALVVPYASDERPALAYYVLSGGIDCEVGDVAAGGTWTGVLTISTVAGSSPPDGWQPVRSDAERAVADAKATLRWWKDALAETSTFDTDHVKLDDLVADWKVLMLVQRCAQSGAVSPMVNYRGAWVRDSTGPILLFLRYNMWDEARDVLEYVFNATKLLGRVPNHVPLDLDFSELAEKEVDWAEVAVPSSEVPSWIILQHLWYWRVTQDTSLILEHWPLLDACLKKQRRGEDSLMTFHGDETWMHGALYSLYPDRVGDGSGFIADDHRRDRDTYSFASSVQFLIALNAMGELVDALDRWQNPERWRTKPEHSPGEAYVLRGRPIMLDIEKRYWLDGPNEKFFAPAISPVTGEPHRSPVANANLMPLWVGWTFPSGEKSRDNLRNSLARLWRDGVRIGSTPAVGYATGHLQGMLLTALTERDGKARLDCIDELLRMAEPAGEFGELYGPDGRPVHAYDAEWPNRLRPWESGVNIDAILFAIAGVRFNAVPNWDNAEIRVELRLPHGATYVTMKDVIKDGRHIHVYMDERYQKLTEEEQRENAKKKPEQRRDPDVPHRRLHFLVELVSDNPPRGYYDLYLNAMNTVYPRYLWEEQPRFEDMNFWHEDTEAFVPEGEQVAVQPAPPRKVDGATVLVLTNRSRGAELCEGATVVDTGLPLRLTDLVPLLLAADGTPAHEALFLDWGWDDPGRSTFKTAAFWTDETWTDALRRYRSAGGRILTPDYFTTYEVREGDRWNAVEAPGGRLRLDRGSPSTVRVRFVSDADRELVLHVGSGCGVLVSSNGDSVLERTGARLPLPDADARLVRVVEGENELVLRLLDNGEPVVYTRLSGADGLPVQGVR